jgi:hypothetical protein
LVEILYYSSAWVILKSLACIYTVVAVVLCGIWECIYRIAVVLRDVVFSLVKM